jgi:hypothetical protein
MHFLIILALSIAVGALLYRFVRQRSPSRVLTLGGAFLASVLTFGALVPTATSFADVTCAGIRRTT